VYLSDDMKDLLRIFNRNRVSYAVCGGFAVAKHRFVRMTLDLDLLIDPEAENAAAVMASLQTFGFGEAVIGMEHLTAPDSAITPGEQPNQIDLPTRMSSTPTFEILKRADISRFDDLEVPVASKEHLIHAKTEANRPKDRIDLEDLENT
jgi:hypothetical protein